MAVAATTGSRIVYVVRCDGHTVGSGVDREEAEDARDAHAARNGNDPLSDRYVISPEFSEGEAS